MCDGGMLLISGQKMSNFITALLKIPPLYKKELWHLGISTRRSFSSDKYEAVQLKFVSIGAPVKALEPIIIIHGLMGSKQNWNSIGKALNSRTKRQVFCVDARNHGDSEHSHKMTYHHMAADLLSLLTSHSLSPAIVIGHSMGGRAAMLLSLKYPTAVHKLVVVDISPIGTSPSLNEMLKYFEALRTARVPNGTPMSAARKIVDAHLSPTIRDIGVRQFLITNLVNHPDGTYGWRMNLDALESHFTNDIARFPSVALGTQFTKPTLFIAGTKSDYVRPTDEEGVLQIFPQAKFVYVEGAGHWVHSDRPQEFLEVVSSFLI